MKEKKYGMNIQYDALEIMNTSVEPAQSLPLEETRSISSWVGKHAAPAFYSIGKFALALIPVTLFVGSIVAFITISALTILPPLLPAFATIVLAIGAVAAVSAVAFATVALIASVIVMGVGSILSAISKRVHSNKETTEYDPLKLGDSSAFSSISDDTDVEEGKFDNFLIASMREEEKSETEMYVSIPN